MIENILSISKYITKTIIMQDNFMKILEATTIKKIMQLELDIICYSDYLIKSLAIKIVLNVIF